MRLTQSADFDDDRDHPHNGHDDDSDATDDVYIHN
jgi:hypothetical protein